MYMGWVDARGNDLAHSLLVDAHTETQWQDKDKPRHSKEYVKIYQEDKSFTYILFQLI